MKIGIETFRGNLAVGVMVHGAIAAVIVLDVNTQSVIAFLHPDIIDHLPKAGIL